MSVVWPGMMDESFGSTGARLTRVATGAPAKQSRIVLAGGLVATVAADWDDDDEDVDAAVGVVGWGRRMHCTLSSTACWYAEGRADEYDGLKDWMLRYLE